MTNPNLSPDHPDFLTDETLHEAYELEIESRMANPSDLVSLWQEKGIQ